MIRSPGYSVPFISVLILAGVVSILIIRMGMGAHFAYNKQSSDAEAAIDWDKNHAGALANAETTNPAQKIQRLTQSLLNNPADSRAILSLAAAKTQQADNDPIVLKQLIQLASALKPNDAKVLAQVAAYLAEQGNIESALPIWDRALGISSNYDKQLFPFFHAVLQQSELNAALKSFVANAGPWWIRFYRYVAQQEASTELLVRLYDMRAPQRRVKPETANLLNALIDDKQWDRAYLVWLGGLNERQQSRIGLLYDGGFEEGVDNFGFGWHAYSSIANLEAEYGIGVSGRKALHIRFQGREKPFYHLFQRIRLRPGTYQLQGRYRPVSLRSLKGVSWRVACINPGNTELQRSRAIIGNGPWERFSVEFEVSESCTVQEVRLVSNGRSGLEHRVRGELWFDEIEIKHL